MSSAGTGGEAGSVGFREKAFDGALSQTPCQSLFDARLLVRFGAQCLHSTPVSGVTPYSFLTAWPGLLNCLALAREWTQSDDVGGSDLLTALELAHQIARKAAGDFHPEVSGPPAACWGVYHLTNGAMMAASAGDSGYDFADTRKAVTLTARLARRTGVELTEAALSHQESLFAAVFDRPLM
jgi:hypothetical protein